MEGGGSWGVGFESGKGTGIVNGYLEVDEVEVAEEAIGLEIEIGLNSVLNFGMGLVKTNFFSIFSLDFESNPFE